MAKTLMAEVLDKEVLTIDDFAKMYLMRYDEASKRIREIKAKLKLRGHELRLDVQGKIHTEDYIDFVNPKDRARYCRWQDEHYENESV